LTGLFRFQDKVRQRLVSRPAPDRAVLPEAWLEKPGFSLELEIHGNQVHFVLTGHPFGCSFHVTFTNKVCGQQPLPTTWRTLLPCRSLQTLSKSKLSPLI